MSVSSGRRAPPQIRDRIVGLRRVRASDLIPNPKNWRRHPKAQADALKGLLGEIGYADALLARETAEGLMLIDGHLRAETTPKTKVPVLVLDLDEAEADKLLLTLDPLAAMAEMDGGATAALLEGVETESEAVQAMLGGLRDQAQKAMGLGEGLTDPDDVPEAPEPVAKRGDVWVCGEHRVMCGDSTDAGDVARLMAGETADALVTDPPYGIHLNTDYSKVKGSAKATIKGGGKRHEAVIGDDRPFNASPVLAIIGSVAEQFWFGGDYYRRTLSDSDLDGAYLVWDKRNEGADPIIGSGFELIWSRQKHKRDVLRVFHCGAFGNSETAAHPTQKPVKLISVILERWTKEGWLILDSFLGSGTTMIAAERLGRRCYGMEIEPRYIDVAVRRWEEFTGRKAELLHETEAVTA